MRRGTVACDSEWKLLCATHNLLKLWRNGKAALDRSAQAQRAATAVWPGKRKEEQGDDPLEEPRSLAGSATK